MQVGAGWQGVVRVLWRHLASERQFVLRARLLVEGPAYRALLELHLILGQGARLVGEDILDLTEVLVEVGRAPPWSGSGLGLSLGLGPGLGLGLGLELGLGSVVRVRARTRGLRLGLVLVPLAHHGRVGLCPVHLEVAAHQLGLPPLDELDGDVQRDRDERVVQDEEGEPHLRVGLG